MSFLQKSKVWSQWIMKRSHESWQLLQGLRRPDSFQQTLVHEAQQGQNATAMSLLRTQKEWNDMKYYGLVPYMQRKLETMPSNSILGRAAATSASLWPRTLMSSPFATETTTMSPGSSSSSGSNDMVSSPISSASSNSTPAAAKVAFMVTARMKQQLGELGYTVDEIKGMTPVEASLLIDNNVPPASKSEKLPQIMKEYEEEQAKLQARQQQEAQEAAAALAAEQSAAQNPPAAAYKSKASSNPSPSPFSPSPPRERSKSSSKSSITEKLLGSIASENVIDRPPEEASLTHVSSSAPREWYEVVEHYENSSHPEEVVALHQNQDEAKVDANLRHEIVTKRAKREGKPVNVQFHVRKTTR